MSINLVFLQVQVCMLSFNQSETRIASRKIGKCKVLVLVLQNDNDFYRRSAATMAMLKTVFVYVMLVSADDNAKAAQAAQC